MITDFAAVGATSGIGILRQTGSAVLKAEITALESFRQRKNYIQSKSFYFR